MINVSDKRPVLTAAMFPNATVIPFTIRSVKQVKLGGRDRVIMEANEHGDHVTWPNTTSLRALVARLGTDESKWIGVTVPLVKVTTENPQDHTMVVSLWVAGADDDTSWNAVDGAAATTPRAAKARKRK